MKEHYDEHYFNKFKKGKRTVFHRLFLERIDKREPALTYLRKRYSNRKTTLLALGCGAGNFLQYADKYFACTGIDTSKEALKLAEKIVSPSTHLIQDSIYNLKRFKSNNFDIVTCFDTLEHVMYLDDILSEVFRILKADGRFVISAPNCESAGLKLLEDDWFGFSDPSHLHFKSISEWNTLLRENGFIPLKTWHEGLHDTPYVRFLPAWLQKLLIKLPTQLLGSYGFPLPLSWGETFISVSRKNPGVGSRFERDQEKMYKAVRKKKVS